jgi:hypothetical protein
VRAETIAKAHQNLDCLILLARASCEREAAIIMPTDKFLCEKCHKIFDLVWSLAEYDKRIGSTRWVKTLEADSAGFAHRLK